MHLKTYRLFGILIIFLCLILILGQAVASGEKKDGGSGPGISSKNKAIMILFTLLLIVATFAMPIVIYFLTNQYLLNRKNWMIGFLGVMLPGIVLELCIFYIWSPWISIVLQIVLGLYVVGFLGFLIFHRMSSVPKIDGSTYGTPSFKYNARMMEFGYWGLSHIGQNKYFSADGQILYLRTKKGDIQMNWKDIGQIKTFTKIKGYGKHRTSYYYILFVDWNGRILKINNIKARGFKEMFGCIVFNYIRTGSTARWHHSMSILDNWALNWLKGYEPQFREIMNKPGEIPIVM